MTLNDGIVKELLHDLSQRMLQERCQDENLEVEHGDKGRNFLATHYAGRVSAWITMEMILREVQMDYEGESKEGSVNPAVIPEERDFRTYE